MRRSLSQLRAIYYAYADKQYKEQKQFLKDNNLEEEFKNSKYKSLTWFINNYKKSK